MTSPRITRNEQTALVRRALKEAFPVIKFSVKQQRGSSINVSWTDGPTRGQVDAIIQRFSGGGFDGMQDLAYPITRVFDGARVHFPISHLITNRRLSPGFIQAILPAQLRKWGLEEDAITIEVSTWDGSAGLRKAASTDFGIYEHITRAINKRSTCIPNRSATAARVDVSKTEIPSYVYGGGQ